MKYSSPITKRNKLESFEQIKPKRATRREQCLQALRELGCPTVNELTAYLYLNGIIPSYTTNFTSPRIRELEQDGLVEIHSRRKDSVSNRIIRTYRIVGSKHEDLLRDIDFKRPALKDGQNVTLQIMKEIKIGTKYDMAKTLKEKGLVPIIDKNYVHPYVYHLEKEGYLEIIGSKLDEDTNRTCTIYKYVGN